MGFNSGFKGLITWHALSVRLQLVAVTPSCYLFNCTFQNRIVLHTSLHLNMVRGTIRFHGKKLLVHRPTPTWKNTLCWPPAIAYSHIRSFPPYLRPFLQLGNEEGYIISSTVICIPYQILFG